MALAATTGAVGCLGFGDGPEFVDEADEPITDPTNEDIGGVCRATPDCQTGLRCLNNGLLQTCVATCTNDAQCPEGDLCLEATNDTREGWCGQDVFGTPFGDEDDDGFDDFDDEDDFDGDDDFDDFDDDDGGFDDDGPVSGSCGSALESEQLRLLNIDRQDQGLPALRCDLRLADVAREHSQDMAERDFFDHVNPDGEEPWDRMRRGGINDFGTAGENIAFGYPTARDVQEGWMDSPGHRANILSTAYTHVGVGVFELDGTLYWTQLFASF